MGIFYHVKCSNLAFVDYAKEFPYLRQEVLPRLEAKGLRQRYEALCVAKTPYQRSSRRPGTTLRSKNRVLAT